MIQDLLCEPALLFGPCAFFAAREVAAFLLAGAASQALDIALTKRGKHLGNDIPMLSLCRIIEIDLREMLGETKLPPKIEAKSGVLM